MKAFLVLLAVIVFVNSEEASKPSTTSEEREALFSRLSPLLLPNGLPLQGIHLQRSNTLTPYSHTNQLYPQTSGPLLQHLSRNDKLPNNLINLQDVAGVASHPLTGNVFGSSSGLTPLALYNLDPALLHAAGLGNYGAQLGTSPELLSTVLLLSPEDLKALTLPNVDMRSLLPSAVLAPEHRYLQHLPQQGALQQQLQEQEQQQQQDGTPNQQNIQNEQQLRLQAFELLQDPEIARLIRTLLATRSTAGSPSTSRGLDAPSTLSLLSTSRVVPFSNDQRALFATQGQREGHALEPRPSLSTPQRNFEENPSRLQSVHRAGMSDQNSFRKIDYTNKDSVASKNSFQSPISRNIQLGITEVGPLVTSDGFRGVTPRRDGVAPSDGHETHEHHLRAQKQYRQQVFRDQHNFRESKGFNN